MGYIFHNFLNTLKHYKVSSLLNILGMTVAFAAFYVIMTQVSYNFSYNKGLKDVDSCMSSPPLPLTRGASTRHICPVL